MSTPRRRPPTLRQVAERAGVSIATASYVVSGRPRALNPETVKKVWEAVQTLGYVPQVSGRSLKGIGTKTLGVIFPHEVDSLGSSPYFGRILDGITDTATEHRYNAMLFTGLSWYQADQGYAVYVDGRCDGHILIAPSTTPELVGQISDHGVPVVVVGAVSPVKGIASFASNNRGAAEKAVARFVEMGHVRIAHVTGNPAATEAQEREAGFRSAMERHRLPVRPEWVFRGDFHAVGGIAAMEFWAKLPEYLRPTAIFCGNDEMAQGVLTSAQRQGIRVPTDLSLIAFDDTYAAEANPPLSSFRQPLREMGRAATRHLIQIVEGNPAEGGAYRFDAPLVERASCAPPNPTIPGTRSRRSKEIAS